jgi:hypothetical protein
MFGPDIGTWNASGIFGGNGFWEALYEGAPISGVTHWADIGPPSGFDASWPRPFAYDRV